MCVLCLKAEYKKQGWARSEKKEEQRRRREGPKIQCLNLKYHGGDVKGGRRTQYTAYEHFCCEMKALIYVSLNERRNFVEGEKRGERGGGDSYEFILFLIGFW